jgi:hypothetical protein
MLNIGNAARAQIINNNDFLSAGQEVFTQM